MLQTCKLPVKKSFYFPRLEHGHFPARPAQSRSWWLGYRIVARIKIHIHHSITISKALDFEEIIRFLLESWNIFEFGRFDQFTFGIVAPAMVSATKNQASPGLLPRYSISTMATDIVEGTDYRILATNEEDWVSRWSSDAAICSGFGEAASMRSVDPCLEHRDQSPYEHVSRGFDTLLKSARFSSANLFSDVHQSSGNSTSFVTTSDTWSSEAGFDCQVSSNGTLLCHRRKYVGNRPTNKHARTRAAVRVYGSRFAIMDKVNKLSRSCAATKRLFPI